LDPVGEAQLHVLASCAFHTILGALFVPATPLPVYYPRGSEGWGLDLPVV
jgi:hypothetical protein